jgi:hypothetical protein
MWGWSAKPQAIAMSVSDSVVDSIMDLAFSIRRLATKAVGVTPSVRVKAREK